MKKKTIGRIINKKMSEWWRTIEDADLRDRVKKSTIVTGGCIASMLLCEQVNDFDIYFKDKETAFAVAKYYVGQFEIKNKSGIECGLHVIEEEGRIKIVVQSAGIASEQGTQQPYEYFEANPEASTAGADYVSEVMQDPGQIEDAYQEREAKVLDQDDDGPAYRPVFISTNAITLSNRVQIVLRFFGEPEEIHKNYDFVHCTNYWSSWDGLLKLHQPALESLLAKELRYVGSKYPICSLFRLRKFIARGWTINAGQVLKISLQISELDLSDIKVLEDQLTGVDVAYFVQLVKALKEKDPEKVNAAYLVEILDRMF